MDRRRFLGVAGLSAFLPTTVWGATRERFMETTDEKIPKLDKSKDEWRELLDRDAYLVLFEEETERSHTSPLNREKWILKARAALC